MAMDRGSRIYDATEVTVLINGVFITGFAEGTFVNIEKDEDCITPSVGAQGSVAVAKINNGLHTVTLTLQQTSPSVTILDRLQRTTTPFTVSVTNKANDGSIDESFNCREALMKKPAARVYSSEIETREYEIQCLDGSFDGTTEDV